MCGVQFQQGTYLSHMDGHGVKKEGHTFFKCSFRRCKKEVQVWKGDKGKGAAMKMRDHVMKDHKALMVKIKFDNNKTLVNSKT